MRFNASQMKESAYAALVKEAKLTGAQTIINVTMEQVQRQERNFVRYVFGLAPKYEQAITVFGTVIEFLPAGVAPTHSAVVESYRYGEPLVEATNNDTNTIQRTDNNQIIMDAIPINSIAKQDTIQTRTVQPVEIVHSLPSVDANSHKPSYAVLKDRYSTQYPWFWNAIVEVRKYFDSYYDDRTQEMEKVTQFLLSDNEERIKELMQDISDRSNLSQSQMAGLFLYYAQRSE